MEECIASTANRKPKIGMSRRCTTKSIFTGLWKVRRTNGAGRLMMGPYCLLVSACVPSLEGCHRCGNLLHSFWKRNAKHGVKLRYICSGIFALQFDSLGQAGTAIGKSVKSPLGRNPGSFQLHFNCGRVHRMNLSDDPVERCLSGYPSGTLRTHRKRSVQLEFGRRVGPVRDVRPVIPGSGRACICLDRMRQLPSDSHGSPLDVELPGWLE